MKSKIWMVAFLACMIFRTAGAIEISETKLKEHISYLSSEELEGRLPGTPGERMAYEYIEKQFTGMGLKPIGENGFLQSFDYKHSMNPHDTVKENGIDRNGTNVLAFLDNGAEKTVVIGAHYDHLGYGDQSNSLDTLRGHAVHNGADDNASGTAGVMELARILSGNGIMEKSNYLFACFSAEESGLIGSKYFTNNPTIDFGTVSYMINMDMIGRLVDSTKRLIIYGTGTSPTFETDLPENFYGLTIVSDSTGIGPSDHTSFYLKNIPVLFFTTGQHIDHHKSTDDEFKINYPGEKIILEYMLDIIKSMDNRDKLAFKEVASEPQERVNLKVTLGVMPDYAFQGKGLRIDAVTGVNGPADRAGIKSGDIIVKMDTTSVEDIYDYMKCLGMLDAGDSTAVTVKRGESEVDMMVRF